MNPGIFEKKNHLSILYIPASFADPKIVKQICTKPLNKVPGSSNVHLQILYRK
jgi:hypothetical protein